MAAARRALGLCADCQHARRVISAHGSVFWRCALSEVNPTYPRYPRLPVVCCVGHVGRGR